MHKDPPPTLLEGPIQKIVLHGMVVGLIASVVFFGARGLLSVQSPDRQPFQPPPRVTLPGK